MSAPEQGLRIEIHFLGVDTAVNANPAGFRYGIDGKSKHEPQMFFQPGFGGKKGILRDRVWIKDDFRLFSIFLHDEDFIGIDKSKPLVFVKKKKKT